MGSKTIQVSTKLTGKVWKHMNSAIETILSIGKMKSRTRSS